MIKSIPPSPIKDWVVSSLAAQIHSSQCAGFVSAAYGTPKGTRTPDLLIRSQSLYPTELSAHNASLNALRYNSTVIFKKQVLFSDFIKIF